MRTHLPWLVVPLVLLGGLGGTGCAPGRLARAEEGVAHGSVAREATVYDVPRAGLNLGHRTSWGAEQLASNLLQNPGFEGMIDRALVIVSDSGPRGFFDDETWLARRDAFWAGASYEIRTGRQAGEGGRILDSRRAGPRGLPLYVPRRGDPLPDPGDVVALTLDGHDGPLAKWKVPDEALNLVSTRRGSRPRGKGARFLFLRSEGSNAGRVISYMDAIGDRAGKLLPIEGAWRVSLWARSETPGARLVVRFGRVGQVPLLQQELAPGRDWERLETIFDARDAGPPGTLEFSIEVRGPGAEIEVDDVELRSEADDGPFREPVLAALRALQPGYLRDWQGQLGDTVENRLASEYARRPTRYRPGGPEQSHYGYSIPEFLDLCERVGARPWLVLPTTIGDEEAGELGRYLAARAGLDRFEEVVLEFGNENWNPLFRPAGIADPVRHASVATRLFSRVRAAGGETARVVFTLGVAPEDPASAARLLQEAGELDALAIAPYVMRRLEAGLPQQSALDRLFSEAARPLSPMSARLGPSGPELAVYEVNLHTLAGDAPPSERDPLVAGAASGGALARRLASAWESGARRQCVYTLSGFDAFVSEGRGLVRLFGVARDLSGSGVLRPTGLALSLVNEAAGGDLHPVRFESAPELHAVALVEESRGALIVTNASDSARKVELAWPGSVPLPDRARSLDADSPFAVNESGVQVNVREERIAASGRVLHFEVPARGLLVLTPSNAEEAS